MNKLEIIMVIIIAICMLFLFRYYLQSFKTSAFCTLITLPAIIISIRMLTEIVTADEYQYMEMIINIERLLEFPNSFKLMFQYRTMQMLLGSVFSLIPSWLKESYTQNTLVIVFKIFHWLLFFIVIQLIVFVIYKKLINSQIKENNAKKAFVIVSLMYILLTLPVSTLILKVSNYDASNIYFAVLALLCEVAAIKHLNKKWAYLGIVIAMLACMEKWSALVYFIVCSVSCVYVSLSINRNSNFFSIFKNALKESVKVLSLASIISFCNLIYIKSFLANGKLFGSIGLDDIIFPITYMLRVPLEKTGGLVIYEDGYYYQNILFYIVLLISMISICASCGFYLLNFISVSKNKFIQNNRINFIPYLNNILILILGGMGIYSTFAIPMRMAPWAPIQEGDFASTSAFMQITYHYGAKTWIEHFFNTVAYAYATIICNLPTVTIVLAIIYLLISIQKQNTEGGGDTALQISLLGALLLPLILVVGGQPSGERYFGVSIILGILSIFIIIINRKLGTEYKFSKKFWAGISLCLIFLLIELQIYSPNIKNFSPVWCIRSEQFKTTVRKGIWYAGESMTWGEDCAIGGRIIKNIIEQEGKLAEETIIYDNYGYRWLMNPGFTIIPLAQAQGNMVFSWNENEYFILSKFKLFRGDIPTFITELKPIATISYKGEISSWIYRGDQLAMYKKYFN